MNIAHRLMVLIGVAVFGLFLVASINFIEINEVYEDTNIGNKKVVPTILLLGQIEEELGVMRVRVYRHILGVEDKAALEAKIADSGASLQKQLQSYDSLATDSEDRRLLADDQTGLERYIKGVAPIIEASRANRMDEVKANLEKFTPTAQALVAALKAHMKYAEETGKLSAAKGEAAKSLSNRLSLGIFLLATLLVVFIGYRITSRIVSKLAVANLIADKIAKGDLSAHPDIDTRSGDELSSLINAIETMRLSLVRTVQNILTSTQSVVASAQELSTASSQVSISTEQQAQATAAAAAAVEELTVSIDHVGSSAEDADARANETGRLAVASAKNVEDASAQVTQVADRVERSATLIQDLANHVQKIGNITTVIREVADQTNLLALNAAIEAARAGEQGRGFAVVADEVRKLAERTSSSVMEISAVIATIQNGASVAVESMQSSQSLVHQVTNQASLASASMLEIENATEVVLASVSAISDALREQRTSSTDLAKNVEAIAQMSEENSAAVASVADTSQRLVNVSDALKASVSGFSLP